MSFVPIPFQMDERIPTSFSPGTVNEFTELMYDVLGNDDGLLDICLVEDISRARMLALVPRFLNGTHVSQHDVTILRTKRITITSQDSLSAHADGELVCTDARHIECEILPRKVRVVC